MPVYNKTIFNALSPTISTSYSNGQVVGGLLELPVESAGRAGHIIQAALTADFNAAPADDNLTLHILQKRPAAEIANGAAFTLSLADLTLRCGLFNFDTYSNFGGNVAQSIVKNIDIMYSLQSTDTRDDPDQNTLFAYLVANGTVSFQATDALTLSVYIWGD